LVEIGLVEIGLLDSGSFGSEFSDFQFADLEISGPASAWFDFAVADLEPAAVAPAGSLCLVLELRLPGASTLWQRKEEQLVEPEPDYSEGA